jgi:hypothetical protein
MWNSLHTVGQPEVRPKWPFHADECVLCNIIISMHIVHAKSGKLKQAILLKNVFLDLLCNFKKIVAPIETHGNYFKSP